MRLLKIHQICVKIFNGFGIAIKSLIVIGLLLGIAESTLGPDIPHTAPIEDGVMVCFHAMAVMNGAFPLPALLSRLIKNPWERSAKRWV